MSSPSPGDPEKLPSIEQFLQTIRRSGLLDGAELRRWLATLPPQFQKDTAYIAEALVRSGKLTRFQSGMILKGRAQGLILGPYQILALIGKGGMGMVYLARDSRDHQLVALKILSPRRAREEERMIARFQREMEMSRKVNHPHVCRTMESGVVNHVLYLAMEFIPGKALNKLVQESGPLEVPRLARLMAGVASGLAHAHEQGLIHRDLKPGNIIVTPHDQAKVLDLGLAMLEGEVVEDAQVVGGLGYIVGTMDYISPEQTYDSTDVDGRTDLYSLGCTIYYALTGQPPFPGGTNKDKIYRHRRDEPTSLLELRPNLPRGFVSLVRRLMMKNPVERIATAQEAEEQLLRWANAESPPTEYELNLDVDEAVAALQAREVSGDAVWGDLTSEEEALEVTPEGEVRPARPKRQEMPAWLVPALGAALLAVLGVLIALLVLLLSLRP